MVLSIPTYHTPYHTIHKNPKPRDTQQPTQPIPSRTFAYTMTGTRLNLLLLILMGTMHLTQSFVSVPLHADNLPIICSQLNAKKSSKQTKKQAKSKHQSTSGFGGAAATPCPCGSGKKCFIFLFQISYRQY